MATSPTKDAVPAGVLSTVELSPMDRAWLIQSCGTQIKALERSRTKEISGGEVWVLRGKELEQLRSVMEKIK